MTFRANTPNRQAACRAAYLAHTRTVMGGLTEAHRLFTRDRALLPRDDMQILEHIHLGLAVCLGGECAESTLQLLDTEILDPEELEEIIDRRLIRVARYQAENEQAMRRRAAALEAAAGAEPARPAHNPAPGRPPKSRAGAKPVSQTRSRPPRPSSGAAGAPLRLAASTPAAPFARTDDPETHDARAQPPRALRPSRPKAATSVPSALPAKLPPGQRPGQRPGQLPGSPPVLMPALGPVLGPVLVPASPPVLPPVLPQDPAQAVEACLAFRAKRQPSPGKPLHSPDHAAHKPALMEPNPFPSLYDRVVQALAKTGSDR